MLRTITPEILDELSPEDPRAQQSRKDLQRINWCMGNVAKIASWLRQGGAGKSFYHLIELGAGDGTFALILARRLAPKIGPMRITLVDRLNIVTKKTQIKLIRLGWLPEIVVADVFEWLPLCTQNSESGIISNLFLHHFSERQLQSLFQQTAAKCVFFAACDPRRSSPALLASHLLGPIGCNSVTCHDATTSVRAGFHGPELSQLWPNSNSWQLLEKETGLFSHAFLALKKAA
jgi:hypothetical protein